MTSDGPDEAPVPATIEEQNALPRFVGIASSAGGLEAVSLLAQNLPQSANAVYVVAQHMSPTHKSVLSTLIARETRLQVRELDAETTPEPDTIYVTPPNSDVTLEQGKLRLRNPAGHPAAPKPSADRLFKSLAAECGERCVGIVLPPTGPVVARKSLPWPDRPMPFSLSWTRPRRVCKNTGPFWNANWKPWVFDSINKNRT